MELTKQELKFAKLSAKRYHWLLFRKNQLIGWIGVMVFGLGLTRILPLPAWCNHLLSSIGFILLMLSLFAFAMTVMGKLYDQVQILEQRSEGKCHR